MTIEDGEEKPDVMLMLMQVCAACDVQATECVPSPSTATALLSLLYGSTQVPLTQVCAACSVLSFEELFLIEYPFPA